MLLVIVIMGVFLVCFVGFGFLQAMKEKDNTRTKISLIINLRYENEGALLYNMLFY